MIYKEHPAHTSCSKYQGVDQQTSVTTFQDHVLLQIWRMDSPMLSIVSVQFSNGVLVSWMAAQHVWDHAKSVRCVYLSPVNRQLLFRSYNRCKTTVIILYITEDVTFWLVHCRHLNKLPGFNHKKHVSHWIGRKTPWSRGKKQVLQALHCCRPPEGNSTQRLGMAKGLRNSPTKD